MIITEHLTVILLLNSKYKGKNIESKIANVVTCKEIKYIFLDGN